MDNSLTIKSMIDRLKVVMNWDSLITKWLFTPSSKNDAELLHGETHIGAIKIVPFTTVYRDYRPIIIKNPSITKYLNTKCRSIHGTTFVPPCERIHTSILNPIFIEIAFLSYNQNTSIHLLCILCTYQICTNTPTKSVATRIYKWDQNCIPILVQVVILRYLLRTLRIISHKVWDGKLLDKYYNFKACPNP